MKFTVQSKMREETTWKDNAIYDDLVRASNYAAGLIIYGDADEAQVVDESGKQLARFEQ